MMIKQNLGFSMVEVMVAITISLILMLGLLQTFISNKNNYRLENNYNTMHENARFSYDYLSKVIRNTAYRTPQLNSVFTQMDTLYDAGNLHVSGANNTGTNNSDILTIRYQGNNDGSIRDCLNVAINDFATATMTFSISNNNQLVCRSQNPSSATPDNTQVILSDVENLQVLYGEDLDGDRTPNRFVESTHPNLNMQNVVAIRLSVLLRSQETVRPTADNTTYNLNGAAIVAPGDNFLRVPMTFTIMLRNMITEVTA